MTTPPKKPRLGGGLDALIPSGATRRPAAEGNVAAIEELHPNRGQPRRRFDEAALEELAQSIRELGVLEPILVRRRQAGGYEIIAGERRWRAAQRAGLREVPIFVRELSPKDAFEAALVENLQRADLSPLETARAFQRLIDEHGHTQETIAKRVGKDRSTISNALRLLKLPPVVMTHVDDGRLSEGHARALLVAQDVTAIEKLAAEAVAKGWSVRETEKAARDAGKRKGGKKAAKAGAGANVRDLETRLSRALGARVRVEDEGGKGRIVVPYTSLDELDRLLEKLL